MSAKSLLSSQLRSVANRLDGDLTALEQYAQLEAAGKLLVAAWRAGCLDDTPALAKLVERHEEPTPPQDGAQAVLVRCASNLFIEFCGNATALVDRTNGSPTTCGIAPGVLDQYAPGMLPPTDPLVPWNDRVLDDQHVAVCKWLAERVEGLPVVDNCAQREADGEPMAWRFEVDAAVYRGKRVPLVGKEYALLVALVEAGNDSTGAPRAVSIDDLIDAVWGHDQTVQPENLRQRLSSIRKVLRRKLDLPDSFNPIPKVARCERAAWRLHPDLQQEPA